MRFVSTRFSWCIAPKALHPASKVVLVATRSDKVIKITLLKLNTMIIPIYMYANNMHASSYKKEV